MIIKGIYKITSPSGKIYIGQSLNIKRRFKRYKSLDCKSQIRLYNSFNKYGIESHIFEIQEITENLNERERYWQDYYNCIGKNGLNCMLTKTNEKPYEYSISRNLKIIETRKKNGYKPSQETKDKIRKSLINHEVKEETRIKLSIEGKNRIITKQSRLNMSGRIPWNIKKVINIETGVIYKSCKEASDIEKISYKYLQRMLTEGQGRENTSNLRYL